jgi:hypothetical protein
MKKFAPPFKTLKIFNIPLRFFAKGAKEHGITFFDGNIPKLPRKRTTG